ncbi:rhomboid family intramembrane serine protease [Bifidobacterium moukalabense]|uniref:rhomboid family intramembrane serine protease n=1 Tax=Bifidobacterium moukalabense TaxID=1333651 RepID=UPI0010F8E3CC|nr:rhomboid family intramembrane serine protease [Bifidobacterium moukalabense]
MAYQRFSLFPDSPSFKDLFSAHSLRYRWRNGDPLITAAIMAICIVVWIAEALLNLVWQGGLGAMLNAGMLMPATAIHRPWTFITSMFLHQPNSLWHILFNMLTLWCVGPVLERMMGHWPFLALYTVSGLAGGTGMMIWAVLDPSGSGWLTPVYGASGALFGLFAAILVVYRRIGLDIRSMMIWMLINFLMPIIMPNIAWQAHLGGFLFGGIFTWLLVSGVRALRGRSLVRRTLVYGVIMVIAIIAIDLLCNMGNPVGAALL